MSPPKYVVDTCSLTKMRHTYPPDVFPTAWTLLTELAETGCLLSVEDVFEELNLFDDEILRWAKERKGIFLPLEPGIQARATTVLSTHPGLLDLKKNKSSADPFVVATAIEHSCAVVTEEQRINSPVRSKIPNVCDDLGVECIDIVEVFRREGLQV